MNKCALELYNKIVSAPIGELVSTRHKNGKDYHYGIEDALKEQGYTDGQEFSRIFDWGTAQTFIKKLADIKPYAEPTHNLKIGDIFYNSWGYDQTNIDFYQVVSVTAKTVSIREIRGNITDYNAHNMTGHTEAKKDSFCSDIIRKTPFFSSGSWYLNMEFGVCVPWDGKPKNFSCYA